MKVTYLYLSGFCVEMEDRVLIFDYWKGELPVFDKTVPVYVFVSHGHMDHYNPEIFKLKDRYEHIKYIISDDVEELPDDEAIIKVHGNRTYQVDDIFIKTYYSTDVGVAFVLETCGKRICHFGDLNWWHWNSGEAISNQWQEKHYKMIIQQMKKDHYDLVFGPPLDHRLEDAYWYGMDEFLKNIDADVVFPMHFGIGYQWIDKYLEEHPSEKNKKIVKIHHKNEVFEL